MSLTRKTSFWVDLSIFYIFLDLMKTMSHFRIVTAFRAQFDGVYLQTTNKAKSDRSTPHFLDVFLWVKVSSNRKYMQIWSIIVWACFPGRNVIMEVYGKVFSCLWPKHISYLCYSSLSGASEQSREAFICRLWLIGSLAMQTVVIWCLFVHFGRNIERSLGQGEIVKNSYWPL